MVLVATLNLYLIVFDLAYLPLRPTIVRFVPVLAEVYDPVKGITPHPVTEAMLADAALVRAALAADDEAALEDALARLRALTTRMVAEDVFARSGQSRQGVAIELVMLTQVFGEVPSLDALSFDERLDALASFWEGEAATMRGRLAVFDEQIAPRLEVNYARDYGLDGRPIDWFWVIDLPFLLLFWTEFAVRWVIAIRRKRYPRWFLFPIFNWYDVLGFVPAQEFRFFRLFRIGAIYVRLRRSVLSSIGDDVISKTGRYFYDIIAEEISDLVAIRILSETQDEVRDGTHVRIASTTLAPRREEICRVVAAQLQEALASEDMTRELQALYALSLDNAVERSERLRSVPLPDAIKRPLVREIGSLVLDASVESLASTVRSEEGRLALERLVGSVYDHLAREPLVGEIETLGRTIAIDVLEEMKRAVAVKKWTQN